MNVPKTIKVELQPTNEQLLVCDVVRRALASKVLEPCKLGPPLEPFYLTGSQGRQLIVSREEADAIATCCTPEDWASTKETTIKRKGVTR